MCDRFGVNAEQQDLDQGTLMHTHVGISAFAGFGEVIPRISPPRVQPGSPNHLGITNVCPLLNQELAGRDLPDILKQ